MSLPGIGYGIGHSIANPVGIERFTCVVQSGPPGNNSTGITMRRNRTVPKGLDVDPVGAVSDQVFLSWNALSLVTQLVIAEKQTIRFPAERQS